MIVDWRDRGSFWGLKTSGLRGFLGMSGSSKFAHRLLILIKKADDKIAHPYRYKGGDKARELERMVKNISADVGCACSVEVDCCHFSGIIRYKEVAVNCGEHGNQC